jgi:putative hydrolase of the HAD superfamily
MRISAVLFDLDETLVPDETVTEAAMTAICAPLQERYGVNAASVAATVRRRARELWRAGPGFDYCLAIGIASWEGLWGDCSGADPNLARLAAWLPEYRREAWLKALFEHGIRDQALALSLATHYPGERQRLCAAFDDAEPALSALHGRYRLGVVTNGAPALQRKKLTASGCGHFFGAVAVSGDIGAGKPDPRIFEHALAMLGAQAGETALVGDSLTNDVAGARQAGIRAIWLNRAGTARRDGPGPDTEIRNLHDLAAALG